MAWEPQGCVQALRCPYHGWVFGLDGSLKQAAYPPEIAALVRHALSEPARALLQGQGGGDAATV